jgi:hypothetical protein
VETTLPSGRKIEETSTASFNSPPPLSRRSSTTPSAPLSIRLRTARRTSPWAPEVKPDSDTWATLRDPIRTIEDSTTGMSTCARSSRTRRSRLPLMTVSVTEVPAGPLILAVEASDEAPAIERPLTAVTTSPGSSPPRLAGEPS